MPALLDASLTFGDVLLHVHQSTVHTLALGALAWKQNGQPQQERILMNHFMIYNNTQETLRIGQVR